LSTSSLQEINLSAITSPSDKQRIEEVVSLLAPPKLHFVSAPPSGRQLPAVSNQILSHLHAKKLSSDFSVCAQALQRDRRDFSNFKNRENSM
jgi:hypothetical protein